MKSAPTIFLLATPLLISALVGHAYSAEVVFNNPEVIAFRFGERMIVAVSGVLALFLGYRLFDKAITQLGNLEAGLPGNISLKVQSVGPGVFFALFGTAMLLYVMFSKVELPSDTTSNRAQAPSAITWGAPQATQSPQEAAAIGAHALEVVRSYATTDARPTDEASHRALSDAIQIISKIQATAINQAVGAGAFEDWTIAQSQEKIDPSYRSRVSPELSARLDAVERILEDGEL